LTSTLTATASPTATTTPTASATPTPTATATSTATSTPTATPTATSDGITLDIDASGDVEPLTDGLLVLRYLFGFSGGPLVAGAVDVDQCGRCTAGEIETYLDSIVSQLDADGDGETEPLTDGLLVLRWLFGFSGGPLVAGAVDTGDCTRCSAEAIAAYLDGLDG
jgi:hypothetical protein